VEKGESNGLLYIVEQLPGMMDSLDVSGILIRYGESSLQLFFQDVSKIIIR
jgi:hypothetical protein